MAHILLDQFVSVVLPDSHRDCFPHLIARNVQTSKRDWPSPTVRIRQRSPGSVPPEGESSSRLQWMLAIYISLKERSIEHTSSAIWDPVMKKDLWERGTGPR